jgi:hypothetical protein
MNIYFTTSFRNAEENTEKVETIINHIKAKGDKVHKRTVHVTEDDFKKYEKSIGHVVELTTKDLTDTYNTILKKIRSSDAVIADTSTSSSSVGYELAIAQTERKPILVLHDSKNIEYLADVVSGNTSKLLSIKTLSSTDNIGRIIDDFLVEAKSLIDTKFILIISPGIDKYLEWASSERRMHKAQIVRNAIEDMMEKDKDYKQFLKELEGNQA